jgi:hypothetical protein
MAAHCIREWSYLLVGHPRRRTTTGLLRHSGPESAWNTVDVIYCLSGTRKPTSSFGHLKRHIKVNILSCSCYTQVDCLFPYERESTKQYQTVLYSINIGPSESTDNVFNLVHSFSDSIPRFVLAIDIANRFLVVSSSTSTLDILGWDTEQGNTFGISLDDVDTEESVRVP